MLEAWGVAGWGWVPSDQWEAETGLLLPPLLRTAVPRVRSLLCKVWPGIATSVSPGSLLEMQNLFFL